MYKEVLALDNLQWLICYKTQPDQKEVISRLNDKVDSKSISDKR